jgi:hypothetical protein
VEAARVTGPLISDPLGPLLESMWFDSDKNAGIPRLQKAIGDWDEEQRAAAKTTPKSVPVGAAPPNLNRVKAPVKAAAPTQPTQMPTKRVDFDTGSRPTHQKGKSKARSPQRSNDDDDDDDDKMDHRRAVPVGPPGKIRAVAVTEKRAREDSDEAEEAVLTTAAAPPPKKKRIVSERFIEDSDEGEDGEEVGGLNPYPCSHCLERKVPCEWLLDTGKKTCRCCARGKVRCSTMQENKEALREQRRAVQRAAKRNALEMQEVKPRPTPTAGPKPPTVTVKRAAPPVVSGVSQTVLRDLATAAAEREMDAKLAAWNKKFQGES